MRELSQRSVKQHQLCILQAADRWCRVHDVRYFLAYGTLLGAVRHQGYIPWDDDIDICMMRPDYERFIRQFNSNRQDHYRVLHSGIDRKFPYEFAKIHDIDTKLVENTGYQYDIGVNIDVFVLDAVPGGTERLRSMIGKRKKYTALLTVKNMYITKKKRALWKEIMFRAGKAAANLLPISVATTGINRIARKYMEQKDCRWLADVCTCSSTENQIFKREWFDRTVEVQFEGLSLCAPGQYEKVLTAWYGEYLQLPPEEERVTHHAYRAYLR